MKTNEEVSSPFEDIEGTLKPKQDYWEITDNGDIQRKDRHDYVVPADRFLEQNWITHLLKKVDKNVGAEFYFVFIEALRRAGYKKLTINLDDIYAPLSVE